jgi:ubiquinone/menaquinone biosynthesis C-methylase UbiE
MLSRVFIFLCGFPPLKRALWKRWYNFLAVRYPDASFTFMNYGYALSSGETPPALAPEDEPNRYCIQMYDRVAAPVQIRGRRVLEVGSGRGGGASYITRYLAPASMTGVDYSGNAVEFCRTHHPIPNLAFQEGSAEALPFADSTFDVVLNVESSHCYGSMEAFLREVSRVLRPGGSFAYADFREEKRLEEWGANLRDSGMRVLSETNITPNVVAALDADNERKAMLIRKLVPKPLLAACENFAGMRGSAIYQGFRSGRLVYKLFVMEKET